MTTNGNRIAPYQEQSGKGPALAEHRPRLRGLLALCLCFCLTLGLLPAPAQAADEVPTDNWTDSGNYDTSWYTNHFGDSEYTLNTAAELAGLAKLVNDKSTSFTDKTIRLGADMDLSDHLWVPIGNGYNSGDLLFAGTFDGNKKQINGLMISISRTSCDSTGFFGEVPASASIFNLKIVDASVNAIHTEYIYAGLLAGSSKGNIYNCSVSGSISASSTYGSHYSAYAGGLVGRVSDGSIRNCSARISSMTVSTRGNEIIGGSLIPTAAAGGIAALVSGGSVENCFADVDAVSIHGLENTAQKQFPLAPVASYSYWDATTQLTDNDSPVLTGCSAVSAAQIAGRGSVLIGGDPYAKTPSLMVALNNWVANNGSSGKYIEWTAGDGLLALPSTNYIDITTVPDQTKEGTAGQVNADVKLEGQVQQSAELISVTLPASIPFIMDVDAAGALNRVLSATATLTNRSDVGVTVTLTDVVDNDPTPLLDKADFVLVPDPDPTGSPVTLTAGTGKTDVLAILAAPADGVPTTSLLKVDGAARADVASVGSDGDSFTIGLTLKVNKT